MREQVAVVHGLSVRVPRHVVRHIVLCSEVRLLHGAAAIVLVVTVQQQSPCSNSTTGSHTMTELSNLDLLSR